MLNENDKTLIEKIRNQEINTDKKSARQLQKLRMKIDESWLYNCMCSQTYREEFVPKFFEFYDNYVKEIENPTSIKDMLKLIEGLKV